MSIADKRIFAREIIFVETPLDGWYRFKDLFQIFPADFKDMPTSKSARHYPVVLEYWYLKEELDNVKTDKIFEGLEDSYQLTSVTYNKTDLFMSLLSLTSTHQFFRYHSSDERWGFPILKDDAGAEANTWSSKWCLSWFMWPSRPEQLKIKAFTEPSGESVKQIGWRDYFQNNPNFDWFEDTGHVIRFPDLISIFFECYFATDSSTRKTLDSAIASSNDAMEFMTNRKKISLLSAFTAIETMVNYENKESKPTKCEKCGQDVYKISAKYRTFLLTYIGDSPGNKAKFNEYYSLRSKIVHAGQTFETEKLFSEVDEAVKSKEKLQMAEVVVLSKLAIILWTIKTSKFYNAI